MTRYRLRADVAVEVFYEDKTPFGSPTTTRPEQSMRSLFAPVVDHARRNGFADLLRAGPRLLEEVVGSEAFARVARPAAWAGWTVRAEVCAPDPDMALPRWLVFRESGNGAVVKRSLGPLDWPVVHGLVADLAEGNRGTEGRVLGPQARRLLSDLVDGRFVEPVDGSQPEVRAGAAEVLAGADLTFVGHNTVVVRSGGASLVVDPFLFPQGGANPSSYQPLSLRELGRFDAVLVTHSHPDHFDPASLLQFPPDTHIVVPDVGPETVLCVDMARRIEELGFTHCSKLPWGASTRVCDLEVSALPFYGEQPTDSCTLHPDIRNAGNTYVVRTPRFSVAFVSDSGRDNQGDVKDVASDSHRQTGPVDAVFSGYRGWITYPVELLFSSVARYLLFVPPHLWRSRLQLMSGPNDALDVAERWGARYLFPYADGGAPWFWSIGLGARLDGTGTEDPDFDPFPERVVEAAARRVCLPMGTVGASPVEVLVLRPGDSVQDLHGSPNVSRVDGHGWAFGT
jgi:L-ascorbate metabolism protein UlaG (beta-lactamase superfamily)